MTISFGGDVHFEGSSASALHGGLAAITPVLSAADITVVNLETAITDGGDPAAKKFTFRAPASAFPALRRAGVDVASMANNHGMDYGLTGLRDSLAAAAAADFPLIGIGLDEEAAYAPYTTTVRGQRIAIIGATQVIDSALIPEWTAGPDKPGLASAKRAKRLARAVREAEERADTVVVDLHWGRQRVNCPLERQQTLAQQLVEAGADVIVGSHAHTLLGGGYLGGAYVDYGLGNFVFYSRSGPGTETGVVTVTVRGDAVTDATWTPARIRAGVPVPLTGAAAEQALAAKKQLRSCTDLTAAPTNHRDPSAQLTS